jgi:hypothetical protein
MKILVACEESQAVTIEFRKKGHKSFSCDIEPCSGGHPEWHIQGDVTPLLSEPWDMIIAFPPCTYLTVTGNRWFNVDRYGEKATQRHKNREEAKKFFMLFANANCEKIAIENPVGVMSTHFRKPDQIINPWQFGDPFEKLTCLWLKNLPPLFYTKIVKPPPRIKFKSGCTMPEWYAYASHKNSAKIRSKTFPGIARAMADQWGTPKNPASD